MEKIKTYGDLRYFLSYKVTAFELLFSDMVKEVTSDAEAMFLVNTVDWMRHNSISMVTAAIEAHEAKILLHAIYDLDDAADIPVTFISHAIRQLANCTQPVAVRNSNVSRNVADDAEREFWLDLTSRILKLR